MAQAKEEMRGDRHMTLAETRFEAWRKTQGTSALALLPSQIWLAAWSTALEEAAQEAEKWNLTAGMDKKTPSHDSPARRPWCPDWTWDARDQLWWPTDRFHENHWNPDYRFCEWCGAKRP